VTFTGGRVPNSMRFPAWFFDVWRGESFGMRRVMLKHYIAKFGSGHVPPHQRARET
jgi:hypothetical protein